MAPNAKPNLELAKKVLPPPLYECLETIFKQQISGLALVGGTALAGFYFGHRRSDDLDLFTKDENSQKAALLASKSLTKLGVEFSNEFSSQQYFRATCSFKNHLFTLDIVLDPHLFEVGQFEKLSNHVTVASLETLFMTKAATLVSRCSEKDLYDLFYLMHEIAGLTFEKLIQSGQKIDAGVNGEALLLSISSTKLDQNACQFSLDQAISPSEIYQKLLKFQKELIGGLTTTLKNQPSPLLKELVQRIKKLK